MRHATPWHKDVDLHDEGHRWGVDGQTPGQFRGTLGHYRESESYNPNDLLPAAPNEIVSYVDLEYGIYKPFGAFNQMWNGC